MAPGLSCIPPSRGSPFFFARALSELAHGAGGHLSDRGPARSNPATSAAPTSSASYAVRTATTECLSWRPSVHGRGARAFAPNELLLVEHVCVDPPPPSYLLPHLVRRPASPPCPTRRASSRLLAGRGAYERPGRHAGATIRPATSAIRMAAGAGRPPTDDEPPHLCLERHGRRRAIATAAATAEPVLAVSTLDGDYVTSDGVKKYLVVNKVDGLLANNIHAPHCVRRRRRRHALADDRQHLSHPIKVGFGQSDYFMATIRTGGAGRPTRG